MEGWVRLHRQTLDSEIFASEKGFKIWCWMLMKANFKNRFVPLTIGAGQSVVELKRGQLLFGRFSAEDELGINGSTIYKWVKKMESEKMINLQSNSHYTIITICNFDTYNPLDDTEVTADKQPDDSRVTTEEQQSNNRVTHLKKDKKENNNKNIYNEFYDNELLLSNNDEEYETFVKFLFGDNEDGKVLTGVLSITEQLTYKEFLSCIEYAKTNNTKIGVKLLKIENDKRYYKGKTSLSRVLKNWLSNRFVK